MKKSNMIQYQVGECETRTTTNDTERRQLKYRPFVLSKVTTSATEYQIRKEVRIRRGRLCQLKPKRGPKSIRSIRVHPASPTFTAYYGKRYAAV